MVWAFINPAERATIREIDREVKRGGDRSAALVAAAFVEQRLTEAVKAAFIRNAKVENKMFKGVAPLATFSAKIDLGLLLGLYSEGIHKALHTVREIRNCFAHTVEPTTFRSQKVRDHCNNLALVNETLFMRAPLEKIEAALKVGVIEKPLFSQLILSEIFNAKDTPRNRYIAAVKALLLLLRIAEHFAGELAHNHMLPFASSPEKFWQPPPPPHRSGNQIHKRRKPPPRSSRE